MAPFCKAFVLFVAVGTPSMAQDLFSLRGANGNDAVAILDLKVLLNATDSEMLAAQAEAELADSCGSGLIGMALRKYPAANSCVNPCRWACPALNAILVGYMFGGKTGAQQAVCRSQYRRQLKCLFGNMNNCGSLVSMASGYGITIPRNEGELNQACAKYR